MKRKLKLALLGGDLRQLEVAKRLSRDYTVGVWGAFANSFGEDIILYTTAEQALGDADAVILPLPVSTDGTTLNCPGDLSRNRIKLTKIIELMKEDGLLIGGKLPETLLKSASEKNVKCVDYFDSEAFQIKNAYVTAEAAVSIAMNSLNKSIVDSRFAITGYGRIASQLAMLLKKLGAEVTVAARKESDLAYAECIGCKGLKITQETGDRLWYKELLSGYDVIFNTAPVWLFDRAFLTLLDKKAFIIDLASAPGGVDVCAAKELGSNVLWATSLPGKYAPESAGAIIADCITRILKEELDI